MLHGMARLSKCVPWWCLFAVGVVTTVFFWRVLFLGEHIAFRDGAHFYPPLFEYVQSEWQAGRVPLWNPYENLGQPLLANPVSSVFYPGKLVYFLPISPYHAYHLYVIGHVLLAAWSCYRLARHFGGSRPAATIATLSYVFGGSVLFQYSNVVFLVGAAWLPEAIRQADIMLTTRRVSAMVALGIVFAMFILGGDPQMAWHALILILLLMFFYHQNSKKTLTDSRLSMATNSVLSLFESNTSSGSGAFNALGNGNRSFRSRPLLLLGFSLLVGAMLAAVQWLPSLELGANGDRNLEDQPASLWRSLVVLERGYREHEKHQAWDQVKAGLAAKETQQSGMTRTRYNFSIGPWRLIEYVWPNANGRMFPINTNWGTAISKKWPCSGIWSPSLYMGIIPFLLAVSALRFRKTTPLTSWLSWSFLIFLAGSFGYFGLGWVVNQTLSLVGGGPDMTGLGSPFGGVYWLFSLMLPGYDQFRYPAKLLTVAALMLSLLSARSFDTMFGIPDASEPMHLTDMRNKQRKYRKSLLGLTRLLIFVSFLLIPLVLVSRFWVWLAAQVPDDPVFGGFVVDRALGEAAFSLVHVLNVLFVFFVIVRIFSRQLHLMERSDKPVSLQEQSRKHEHYFARLGYAVVILISCDLATSNHWMVGTAPRHFFDGKPLMATFLDVQESLTNPTPAQSDRSSESSTFPIRTWRAPTVMRSASETRDDSRYWLPKEFAFPSTNRLAEWVIWERASLSPRYPLAQHIAVTDVRGTIVTADYYTVSQILRDAWLHPDPRQRNDRFSLSEYLESLGNSSMIVPAYRKQEDYISEKQLNDPRWTDPIELLDQAAREEAESHRLALPANDHDGEEALAENELRQSETGQLYQWGKNQKSITQLLPYEVNYWPLNAAPRITVADRIHLEQPLRFSSREQYFAKSYRILVHNQQSGIPVVEWKNEHFAHLPTRFARAFTRIAAMGELPRRNAPPDFESRRPVGATELVSYEPQKVVVRAVMHRPGLLILSEQYDANWRAEVCPVSEETPSHILSSAYRVPILRTNRVMRGVPLPEGEWEITFVYDPLSFRLGAAISFVAWATLAMFLLGTMAGKIRQGKILHWING
ncbi:MAG: YfhO family protein [Planctomycetaceae bacterium]|nr:YfhO family protein [Planctomycetaceae bacterium]